MNIFNSALYLICILFIKLSILLLYLRLSPYRTFKAAVWFTIILTVGYCLSGAFQFIFRCDPVAKAWDITIPYGWCYSNRAIVIRNGVLDCLSDIIMLILPIPFLYKLRVPLKEKVALELLLMTSSV